MSLSPPYWRWTSNNGLRSIICKPDNTSIGAQICLESLLGPGQRTVKWWTITDDLALLDVTLDNRQTPWSDYPQSDQQSSLVNVAGAVGKFRITLSRLLKPKPEYKWEGWRSSLWSFAAHPRAVNTCRFSSSFAPLGDPLTRISTAITPGLVPPAILGHTWISQRGQFDQYTHINRTIWVTLALIHHSLRFFVSKCYVLKWMSGCYGNRSTEIYWGQCVTESIATFELLVINN